MAGIRSPRVRGAYHHQLVGVLLEKIAEDVCTQESLADAADMHQTTISGILKRNAGTLDLDEADAVLRHVGSTLQAFTNDPAHAVAAPKPTRLPKTSADIMRILRELEDDERQIVLSTARSVRAKARRAKTRSDRPRVVAPQPATRKIGGKP